MIISHKHKFIFFKGRKTAGTSLEIALSKICGPSDVITPISEKDEAFRKEMGYRIAQNYGLPKLKLTFKHLRKYNWKGLNFYNHMSCEDAYRYIDKKVWNSYFKFTVDRNPYDKVVSFYYWTNSHEKYPSILEFIKGGGADILIASNFYYRNGEVAVDKIYKFEDFAQLEEDLTIRLGLENPFKMTTYKAKSNTRKVRRYQDILDEESRFLIANKFAREIEMLGYEF